MRLLLSMFTRSVEWMGWWVPAIMTSRIDSFTTNSILCGFPSSLKNCSNSLSLVRSAKDSACWSFPSLSLLKTSAVSITVRTQLGPDVGASQGKNTTRPLSSRSRQKLPWLVPLYAIRFWISSMTDQLSITCEVLVGFSRTVAPV